LLERLETRLAPANVDVLRYHYDFSLTGQNLQEQVLHPGPASDPTALNATNFGTLFSYPIDGQAYAQPVYKTNVVIGGASYNVAFVATEHDGVFAFNADSPTGGPDPLNPGRFWYRSFIDPAHGITTIPFAELSTPDLFPEIGITGTPTIDPATSTLYVVVKTREVRGSPGVVHYVQKLHALDLATGADRPNSPYQIGDTVFLSGGQYSDTTDIYVRGVGGGSIMVGGESRVYFNAGRENNRAALQLVGNELYIPYASHADFRPYHGWVIGFDKTTLLPNKVFNTAPNADGVAIWESGGGMSVDDQGNLYFALGNGFQLTGGFSAFDPAHGNYSESVLKIDPTPTWTPADPQMMRVVDYFTPFNWQQLDSQDADLGSGGVLQLPDTVGSAAHRHLMIETGKQGRIYLIDRDNMGHINNPPIGPDLVVQTVTAGQTGVWGNPAFFQTSPTSGIIYYHGSGDVLKGYLISNAHIDDTPAHILRSTFPSNFPGEQPSISADGTADPLNPVNGLVWEMRVDNAAGRIQGQGDRTTAGPAILRAFLANDFSAPVYDSSQNGQRDFFGGSVKFTVPVVTNGHVLVGTADHFSVLGLFPQATATPGAPSNLTATLLSTPQGAQIRLNWMNPPPNPGMDPTGIKIFRSTDGSNFAQIDTVNRTLATYTDVGPFQIGQRYFYRVAASNQRGDSAPSNVASQLVPIPPSVLTLVGTGAASVGLSWTAVINDDHYDVERSTDGMVFARINPAPIPTFQTSYTDTGLSPGQYAYRIHAFSTSADSISNPVGTWVGPTIDHGTPPTGGFANATDLTTNGSAFVGGNVVELTSAVDQAGSSFSNNRMAIARFNTSFRVRLHEGTQPDYADGFTFVLQANAPTALGQAGGGIGYQGITNSVAIKFDTFDNEGETGNSTGLFYGGDRPSVPHSGFPGEVNVPLDPNQVNLRSQSMKTVTLSYDGSTLHETIVDADHPSTPFTHDYTANLMQLIGSDTAYVGFTGGSGSGTFYELEDILSWSFTSQAPLPGAPTNLRQTAFTSQAVDLAWNANSFNETGFQVERSADGTTYTTIGTTTAMSFEDIGVPNGSFSYRVKALGAAGSSPYSSTLSVSLPGAILTQHQDIGTPGNPSLAGSATFANGSYTMTASGTDIWDTADHMHYLYRPFVGDGQIIARVVTEQPGVNDFAKAGVMFRSSLSADAQDAYMLEFPFPGSRGFPTFQWRAMVGGATADHQVSGARPVPIWLRLQRTANLFTGYWAVDMNGTPGPWNALPAETVVMRPDVFVGLALTSHNNNARITATFDHVQILPAVQLTSHLDVNASALQINPGTPVTITVSAFDSFNNVVPGYRGTIHFTISDPMVALPPDYTFAASDNGVHAFTLILRTLGRQTITVTDTGPGGIQGGTAVIVTNDVVPSSFLVAGFPSPAVAGVPGDFRVTARDAMGNTLTGYRGKVHFTSSDVFARLPDDYMFTAGDNGTHVFTATLNTPGTQSITASDLPVGVSGSQVGIQVVAQPSFTTINRSAAAITEGSTLTVSGTFTDPASGQGHQLVVTWGDNTANTTLTLPVGVFTFSTNHAYTRPGNFEIRITVTAGAGGSDSVTLPVTAASILPPGGLTGWWTGDGNNSTTAPDIAGTNPGSLNGGVTYAAGRVGNAFSFDGGDGSFVNIADAPSLNATRATWGFWLKTTQTSAFVGLVGKHDAGGSVNGVTMQLDQGHARVEVKGNGPTLLLTGTSALADGQWHLMMLSFQSGGQTILYIDGQQQASGTAPAFAFNATPLRFGRMLDNFWTPYNGLLDEVQIFNRVLPAGDIQFIFNAGAAGQIKGVRVLSPHFIVTGFPSSPVAGTAGMFTVTVQDPFGETLTGYRGTVHFTSSDGQAMLPGNYTFTAADNGVHMFSATLKTAGLQSITATDTVDAATTGTQSAIMVTPAETTSLALTFPANTTAGEPHALVVVAQDAYGNVTPGYTGTVRLSSSDPQAVLEGDHTFTAADNGRYTFVVELRTAGSQSVTAADRANPMIAGTQSGIVVQAAAAASLTLTGFPSPVAAGAPQDFTVTARDRFGNIATGYTGMVSFTSSDSRAMLPDPYTFTTGPDGDNGMHTFHATLWTLGSQSITVGDGSFAGTQEDIIVVPARFDVSGFPSPSVAGSAGTFTVTALNADGSVAVGYLGTVHLTSSDPRARFSDEYYTFQPDDQGRHTFGVVLETAGTQSITATDADFDGVTGTQGGIIITPSPVAGSFEVFGFPSPIRAGTPGTFTGRVRDIYGNVATGYTGTVTFSSSDLQADLPDDYTFTVGPDGDNGVHVFTATLKTAGSQSITVTDTDNGAAGTQDGIQVRPGVAVTLALFGYPSPAMVGTLNLFTVTGVDAFGNFGAAYLGRVHFTSTDETATLPDDYMFQESDNGTHVFAAIFHSAGTWSLTATDTNDPTFTGTQDNIDVIDGPSIPRGSWHPLEWASLLHRPAVDELVRARLLA
jgi:hypothetical protein